MRKFITIVESLNEAPITDYDYIPDENGTAFNDSDKKLLNNPKTKTKMIKAFEKTPFDIEVTFIDNQNIKTSDLEKNDDFKNILNRNLGIHSDEITLFGHKFTPKDNTITVVMTGNVSVASNKIPMTPWTLAHKIGHSFEDSFQNIDTDTANIVRLLQNSIETKLTQHNLSMRSARTGNIESGEMLSELIAQYLITGKATILPYGLLTPNDAQEYENNLNRLIKKLLDYAVGKIIVEI